VAVITDSLLHRTEESSILAIDSAFDMCSVACLRADLSDIRMSSQRRKHADDILMLVQSLLQTHQLALTDFDAIAMTSGPGSFTGLRIGTAVVQGLAFGSQRPVLCVSSLAALAVSASRAQAAEYVAVCLHAREDEFYFGIYRLSADGAGESLINDCMATADKIDNLLGAFASSQHHAALATGDGWQHPLLQPTVLKYDLIPVTANYDALIIADIARQQWQAGKSGVPAALASPVYLKDELDYRTV